MKARNSFVATVLAFFIGASGNAMANDVVSLKFSDGRPDLVGVDNVNSVLRSIGVHVMTVDIPKAAQPTLAVASQRALTNEEKQSLINQFKFLTADLLELVKQAGRKPAVAGGGVLAGATGFGPYPQVFDMKAMDEVTRKAVLEKYGRMHVNSADDGTDVDEVMTVVAGGPFRWAFTLSDGSIARFQVDEVDLNDKAVRVSYHGLGMHAGMMDAKQGLIIAYGYGPKEFTTRYKANVPYASLLGTNPWVDFSGNMPVVLDKVNQGK